MVGVFQGLLAGFGIHFPKALTSAYNPANGTYIDIPAIIIVFLITLLLTQGVKNLHVLMLSWLLLNWLLYFCLSG